MAHWKRRHLLGAAAAGITLAPSAAIATGTLVPNSLPAGVLVWKSASSESRTGCSPLVTRQAFGQKFINYLARFLLTYDRPSRKLWRSRATEVPLSYSEEQVSSARIKQLGEFVGAVEGSLCQFTPADGRWSQPLNTQDAVSVRQLLTLLRSRYGDKPDALRQLALLFALLPPSAQPTDSIELLAAEQENRAASSVIVIDGGSFVLSDAGLAAGLPAPSLPLPAAPLARKSAMGARAGVPQLRASGRIIELVVTNGGGGYDDDHPPLVSITAPLREGMGTTESDRFDKNTQMLEPWRFGRQAGQARAIVRGGRVVALELLDQGAGYRQSDNVLVAISRPPRARTGRAGQFEQATGRVLLEYEVGAVALNKFGGGYGSSQDLNLRFFPPVWANDGGGTDGTSKGRRGKGTSDTASNFRTPSALELAEAPYSLDTMAAKYGDQVLARSTSDILVLRQPQATLVLGKRHARATAPRSGTRTGRAPRKVRATPPNVYDEEPPPERPPEVRSSPLDTGVIAELLALIPPEDGAPLYTPGKPPSSKYPIGMPSSHRFPGRIYDDVDDDEQGRAPLGRRRGGRRRETDGDPDEMTRGLPRSISAIPTSISGGVRQDVPLSPALVARLALAGGLCSATTRAITSPIDLLKTQAQAAGKEAGKEAGKAAGKEAGKEGMAAASDSSHTDSKHPPASIWLGLDASAAAGFAAGAGSFGTYELLKRSIPELAESVLGPAAPADLSFTILLTACLLQAVAAAVCSSPFETGRAILMAGNGEPGAPRNVIAALTDVMRAPPVKTLSTGAKGGQPAGAAEGAAEGAASPPAREASPLDAPTEDGGSALNVARLWDGLPALMGRELPFGITKLLVYATTQDGLLAVFPAARERPFFGLLISLFSGIVAGLLGAFVSHPADTVVTRLATGGFGRDWRGALDDVLANAEGDDATAKARVLYVGVRERCISLAIVVTAQFLLFDGLRALLAVSKEDLSLILDVFEDRLDFYSGWDVSNGAWLDAIDDIDDLRL